MTMLSDDKDIVADVMTRAAMNPNEEVCGFILQGARRHLVFEADNESHDRTTTFAISAKAYSDAQKLAPIIATYHSHVRIAPQPSEADKRMAARTGLPMLIVSTTFRSHAWVHPGSDEFPYARRLYVYGVFDCFELIRDYYRKELSIELSRPDAAYGWWERGENVFVDSYPGMGFVEVPRDLVRVHDLLLMQMNSRVPDLLAVFAGSGDVLYHVEGRLSCRTIYGGGLRNKTRHVLRHRSQMQPGDLCYLEGRTQKWS